MRARTWEEDDAIIGATFDPAYLRRAKATGVYVGLVAEDGGRVYGLSEAGLMLHPTRGRALRIRSMCGPDQATRPFLTEMRERARRLRCAVLYLASTPHAPDLCAAAMTMKFTRVTDEVAMIRPKAPVPAFGVPGITIRPMRAEEYPMVRRALLPQVSHGSHVCDPEEVRQFVGSGVYLPYVAVAGGVLVAYAELALLHAVPAACYVGRVERVVVDEAARGRNVSRALVGELLRQSERVGCAKVELMVRRDNGPALKTYRALGFSQTDDILYHLAP